MVLEQYQIVKNCILGVKNLPIVEKLKPLYPCVIYHYTWNYSLYKFYVLLFPSKIDALREKRKRPNFGAKTPVLGELTASPLCLVVSNETV